MNSRKLILIDGTAVLYRAFFAIKDLSTKSGQPTNAVFGFVRMLKQVRETWNPTHWVVAFDGGLPKERLALISTYKAQRPSMPDALRSQVKLAGEYLKRAEILGLRMEGQEADDVIASAVEWARPSCESILVATSDKDIFQLVDDKVRIVPVAGKEGLLDAEGIRTKTGVAPSQIIDWLAMVGDSSDNIPGVPGIGAKTAGKLLQEFGSLDKLWAGIGGMPAGKVRSALEGNKALVEKNQAMIRLRRDLDFQRTWEKAEVRAPSPSNLLPFFEELEFGSMAKEIREPDLFQGAAEKGKRL
jgi:DNA polymerase-1